jgi:hypothetical protein
VAECQSTDLDISSAGRCRRPKVQTGESLTPSASLHCISRVLRSASGLRGIRKPT